MRLFCAIAAASLLASPVLAASATGTASVQVLAPLSVSQTQGLSFGNIVKAPAGSANISLTPSGVLSTGSASSFGAHSPATFSITGEAGAVVAVATDPTATLSGPGTSTVTATLSSDAGSAIILNGAGSGTVNVGGSFTLPNGQTGGFYSGAFSVTANYQ